MKKVLVIVPVYNCENRLPILVRNLDRENTIFVDDGSEDNSIRILREQDYKCLQFKNNMGVGSAIKAGVKYGLSNNYKYCITLDGDGQHNAIFINQFKSKLKHNDFVIGNRFSKYSLVPDTKLATNFLASLLIKKLYGKIIYDVTCGYRAFPLSEDILEIKEGRYEFLHTHLLKALNCGKNIASIDIDCIYYLDNLLVSKKEELQSFLTSIFKYNSSAKSYEEICVIAEKINNSTSFNASFDSVRFHAFYLDEINSYIFQIDKKVMHSFYKIGNI